MILMRENAKTMRAAGDDALTREAHGAAVALRILALAPHPWNGPWMNRQHLLSRLGKRHRILFSQGIWTIWDRHLAEYKRCPLFGRFRGQDSITTDDPPRALVRWPTVGWYDKRVIAIGVLRWRRRLSAIGPGPLVAHVFHPMYWPYLPILRPDFVVYHAYDLYSKAPGWTEQLANWQLQLLRNADLAIAASQSSARMLQEEGGREVNEVNALLNAADFDAFAGGLAMEEPADLRAIPHPRIGYTGNTNRKVDLPLIAWLARRHPEWHFVFVGRVANLDELSARGKERCDNLPNVHFLGEKAPSELPAYVSRMDVNTMCYRIEPDSWVSHSYPLKLIEYLAAGRPVVSAPLEVLKDYSNVVAIAYAPEDWEAALAKAIRGDGIGSEESRREVARENTWDKRVEQLEILLTRMVHSGRHSMRA